MNPESFDRLERALEKEGPAKTFAELQAIYRDSKEYHRLFDVLLMQARHDLGMPLVQLGPSTDVPEAVRAQFEDRIVLAARTVGGLYLQDGDIPSAYQYFQMIGETAPIRAAIAEWTPGPEDEAAEAVVDIAVAQGVHPYRGLEIILARYGVCQAITTCEQLLSQGIRPPARDECIRLLIRTLHHDLVGRLQSEIEAKEGTSPAATSIPVLLKGRDWLFADEAYHLDTSHLNAVVRMARLTPKCEELYLAVQLCEYGNRLSSRYKYAEAAPFDDVFTDSAVYFRTVLGADVAKGLEFFRTKADLVSNQNENTYPAEVYVHLLTLAGKLDEAFQYAARKLNRADFRPVFGANLNELCQKFGRYDAMAQMARRRGDAIGYVAGLIQKRT